MSSSADEVRAYGREIVIAADVVVVIALCGLVSAPLPVVAVIWLLIAFAALVSPVAVLAATIVTLPWFYHPIAAGGAHFPASELLLAAAVAGVSAQYAIALIFGKPSTRKAAFVRIRETLTARLFLLAALLTLVLHDGSVTVDPSDEVIGAMLVTHGGAVVHPAVVDAVDRYSGNRADP